jgi:acyl-[acyl carrier protein]--UDP-N-acetylglucosamine O-acyltransferase
MKIDINKYTVHPSAIVDDSAQIGEGSSIWHFARNEWATVYHLLNKSALKGKIFK